MTGFGKAEATVGNKKFTAEIRSLNSKQLDLSVKMPAAYRSTEYEVRNIISQVLVRGKVDLMINVESSEAQTSAHIDRELFRAYLRQVSDALAYSGVDASYDAILPAVMRMPDVVSSAAIEATAEEQAAILAAVREAAAKLDEFRTKEGATLVADLLARVGKIEGYRDEITPYEVRRADAVRDRIRESIAKAGLEADPNRLEQEMIYYIEKFDITEERVRLRSHCNYFREVAAGEEMAGRKLGFIAQEMGREINTTGSKANDHDIQILVVKMKDELEKIKEQVLNIL